MPSAGRETCLLPDQNLPFLIRFASERHHSDIRVNVTYYPAAAKTSPEANPAILRTQISEVSGEPDSLFPSS